MPEDLNLNDQDYERLTAYIDNALTDAERSVLEAQLRDNPALQRELEALRDTVKLVRQLPTLRAPRNFTLTPQMAEQIRPRTAQQTRSTGGGSTQSRILRLPAVSLLSAAASFILVVGGAVLLLSGDTRGATTMSQPADNIVMMQTRQTADAIAELPALTEIALTDDARTEEAAEGAMPLMPMSTTTRAPGANQAATAMEAPAPEEAGEVEEAAEALVEQAAEAGETTMRAFESAESAADVMRMAPTMTASVIESQTAITQAEPSEVAADAPPEIVGDGTGAAIPQPSPALTAIAEADA
ncbi:MAG: anti-sigma factor family protein, partial [Chloroflexota bacterium]